MAAAGTAAEPPLAGALKTGAIVGKRAEHAAASTDCASTRWPLPPSIYSDLEPTALNVLTSLATAYNSRMRLESAQCQHHRFSWAIFH